LVTEMPIKHNLFASREGFILQTIFLNIIGNITISKQIELQG
jgi:hypothetical protein